MKRIIKNELLTGGLSDNMDISDIISLYPGKEEMIRHNFKLGLEVEKEHTNNRYIAAEIARDHLYENPNYYVELSKLDL